MNLATYKKIETLGDRDWINYGADVSQTRVTIVGGKYDYDKRVCALWTNDPIPCKAKDRTKAKDLKVGSVA